MKYAAKFKIEETKYHSGSSIFRLFLYEKNLFGGRFIYLKSFTTKDAALNAMKDRAQPVKKTEYYKSDGTCVHDEW